MDRLRDLSEVAYANFSTENRESTILEKLLSLVRLPKSISRVRLYQEDFQAVDELITKLEDWRLAERYAERCEPKHLDHNSVSMVQNQSRYSGRKEVGRVQCFQCGDFGHMRRECPKPRTTRTCFRCGSKDHFIRQCPLNNRKGNEGGVGRTPGRLTPGEVHGIQEADNPRQMLEERRE